MASRCSSTSSLHSWSSSSLLRLLSLDTPPAYPERARPMYDFSVAERVLTERELNRALLARQLLLERVQLPIPRALERVGGLQTQDARSGYIGLWTRLEGFERDSLTRALERGSVAYGTVMRITIHMVSKRDYWLFTEGIRGPRRESWKKSHARRVDVKTMPAVARKVESK